jgi:hypothetical protein
MIVQRGMDAPDPARPLTRLDTYPMPPIIPPVTEYDILSLLGEFGICLPATTSGPTAESLARLYRVDDIRPARGSGAWCQTVDTLEEYVELERGLLKLAEAMMVERLAEELAREIERLNAAIDSLARIIAAGDKTL